MKKISILLVVLAFVAVSSVPGFAGKSIKVNADALGKLQLPVPESDDAKRYLGLKKGGSFTLPQIKADVLIIEMFSMYCPICQSEAENINKLYKMINDNPKLRRGVRVIGIGINNTPFEVNVFRKKYTVPFPLVPDPDFLSKRISRQQLRTPTFIVARVKDGKGLKVIRTHVGPIDNLGEFLKGLWRK
ncbi:peroxiredoxin family protein [Thermodesulfobacteriota bacterium]